MMLITKATEIPMLLPLKMHLADLNFFIIRFIGWSKRQIFCILLARVVLLALNYSTLSCMVGISATQKVSNN